MPRLSEVLLVDSDARALDALAYGLSAALTPSSPGPEACVVRRATSPSEAAAALATTRPQIAIVGVREPIEPTFELIAKLRGGDNDPLPVVALGAEDLRPRFSALGIDHLVLPAFVRDVLTASRILVSAAATATAAEREMRGALSDVGMYFLLRALVGLRRSAVVSVERANRRGEIRLTKGEVTWAQVGSLQGMAALTHLLLWDEASLELKLRDVPRRGQTFKKGDELLDELERFQRDFLHAAKDLGSVQSLFVQSTESAVEVMENLPVEAVPALRLFDGNRTLGDVIEDSPFRVFDTLRVVSRLLDMGLIRRKAIEKPSVGATRAAAGATSKPAASPSPPPNATLEDWLRQAGDKTGGVVPADHLGDARAAADPDQRMGPDDRRKIARQERPPETREVGTVPRPAPEADPAAPRAAVENARSGSIDLGGEAHSARRPTAPVVVEEPSVVVNMDTGLSAKGRSAPKPAAVMPAPSGTVGTIQAAARRSPTDSGPVTGGSSIQLDPALMAEMDAYEMAMTPPTPPPLVLAPDPRLAARTPASERQALPTPISFATPGPRLATPSPAAAPGPAPEAPTPPRSATPGPRVIVLTPPSPAAGVDTPPPRVVALAPRPGGSPAGDPAAAGPAAAVPGTPAPVTSVPVTSVPVTSVPVTSIPATSVPVTSIPATSVPVTSIPVTSIPVTSIPATSVPVTSIPVTPVPVASVPVTPVPAAAGPVTSSPPASVPAMSSPRALSSPESSTPAPGLGVVPGTSPVAPAELSERAAGAPDASGRRPSAEFDPLEADFFAREADIYDREHEDTDPRRRSR